MLTQLITQNSPLCLDCLTTSLRDFQRTGEITFQLVFMTKSVLGIHHRLGHNVMMGMEETLAGVFTAQSSLKSAAEMIRIPGID